MNEELISIIVPVYNVEEYLKECIDSIINQTYKRIEIILVDDGSTDKSGKICDDYAKIDKRIKVVHKENGGLSDARNVGISVSSGKYIAFVDSDDWVEKTMYKKCIVYVKSMMLIYAYADILENIRMKQFLNVVLKEWYIKKRML